MDEILELENWSESHLYQNDMERKYVNGSYGRHRRFRNKTTQSVVELASGKRVSIKADTWRIEIDGKVRAEISQLPIKLAWAITVHKEPKNDP